MWRAWGKVKKDVKDFWMDINPNDELCRPDAKGNIAYQGITELKAGETKSVPKDYPAWK